MFVSTMKFRFGFICSTFFVLSLHIITIAPLVAQDISTAPEVEFGLDRGLRFNAPDSSFGLRFGARLQSQFNSTISLEKRGSRFVQNQTEAMLRRARILLKAHLLQDEFTYFVNVQFDKGQTGISDAIFCWHPNVQHTFGTGQFRVFDDRQYRISSAYLQFTERSIVSNEFSQGYDIGAFWNGRWIQPDDVGLKLYISVSHEEWKNASTAAGGFFYTTRVELLPLGEFNSKGDYRGGMLIVEPIPRLSIGFAASLNQDAHLTYAGVYDSKGTDVKTLYTDFVYKYQYFSLSGELAWRRTDHTSLTDLIDEEFIHPMFSGYGFFLQAGRMINSMLELNTRFEALRQINEGDFERLHNPDIDRYSLGITYYMHDDNLKMQLACSLNDKTSTVRGRHERYIGSRLQFQLNF